MSLNKVDTSQKGFTILELLVVIVIIGVLSSIVIVSLSGSRDKASISKLLVFSDTMRGQLSDSLVSYWSFNEGSGTTTRDTWSANNGELENFDFDDDSGWRSGGDCVHGGCLKFDGVDDYIDIPNSNVFNSLNGNEAKWTISFWINTTDTGSSRWETTAIIDKRSPGVASGNWTFLVFLHSNNDPAIWIADSSSNGDEIRTNYPINNGKWHFITVTRNSLEPNGVKIFVDGDLKSEGTTNRNPSTFDGIILGARRKDDWNIHNHINGFIDEVHIYSSAADIAQVQKQYVKGLDSLLSNKAITKEEYNERIAKLNRYIVEK